MLTVGKIKICTCVSSTLERKRSKFMYYLHCKEQDMYICIYLLLTLGRSRSVHVSFRYSTVSL